MEKNSSGDFLVRTFRIYHCQQYVPSDGKIPYFYISKSDIDAKFLLRWQSKQSRLNIYNRLVSSFAEDQVKG